MWFIRILDKYRMVTVGPYLYSCHKDIKSNKNAVANAIGDIDLVVFSHIDDITQFHAQLRCNPKYVKLREFLQQKRIEQ